MSSIVSCETFVSEFLLNLVCSSVLGLLLLGLVYHLRSRRGVRLRYLALLTLVLSLVGSLVCYFYLNVTSTLAAIWLPYAYLLNQLNRGRWRL